MTLIDLSPVFEFLGRFLGGPENALIIVGALIKIGLVLGHVLGIIPLIIWAERKIIGWVQDRPGPNRVGPFGLLQGIVDGGKLFLKEDFIPAGADRMLYLMGPPLVVIPAFLAMCIIPWGPVIEGQALLDLMTFVGMQNYWSSTANMPLAITNPNIGVLYVFAITSVGVYGITLAGWASENKWSLLGGIRASAQMISYEISLSLSIVGVLLIVGSLNLYDIIAAQDGPFMGTWWLTFLRWNVFAQPVAFLLFVIAMFAETNRLPFDLAEGEAELTGGFHTEYSSMKFALFFLGEYANMITVSAVCATLFLGGYLLIPEFVAVGILESVLTWINVEAGLTIPLTMAVVLASFMAPLGLALKIGFFLFVFIMARAVYPRFRYDQVMNLGWKIMLPIGLANLVVTAIGIAVIGWIAGPRFEDVINDWKIVIGAVTFAGLVVLEIVATKKRNATLRADYQNIKYTKSRPTRRRRAASAA
ncbi:MAG: NADH-quinone oxidoreductase subunit NuoH [Sumerlaeia bacterium]